MVTRYAEYDPFAWVYNRHWGKDTLRFCPVLEALLLPELPQHARILDLCCGTGQIARWLTDHRYVVNGVDGSEGMLHFARENAPQATFQLADARSFTLPTTVHAAVSTFDSLNHILSSVELTAVFRNVHAVLEQGGVLLCDLNIRQGYLERWDGQFNIVEDDHVCAVCSRYDDDTRLATFDMTLFRLQESWQRTDITLTQYAYEEADICQVLSDAGFDEVHVFDAKRCPEGLASLPGGRAFFLARRR